MYRATLTAALVCAALPAQDRSISIPGTETRVRTVSHSGGERSEVSRDGGSTWTEQAAIDTRLHLRYGTFDPNAAPWIPPALHAPANGRLFIVQFHTQIIREFRAALNGMGAELHHYLPSQSYLVRMDASVRDRVVALPFVRSVTAYHKALRLDPEIIVGLGRPAGLVRYTVVMVDKRRDVFGLERAVVALGARNLIPANGGILFEASMTEAQMLAVAGDDRVLWIEKSSAPEIDIDNARIQAGTNYVETQAGIAGIGMTGHVMEGIHSGHTEFRAIAGVRSAPIGVADGNSTGHGTNTAGEIYARGASPLYRGLMPNAQITYTNYDYVYNRSTRYSLTQTLQNTHRVMLQTASWGYGRTLNYTSRSAEMDDIIFDLDMFITQSQSNAGNTSQPRASRPQAWAKNMCSVGGFRHRDNSDPNDDYWGRSGSTGPASDGRIGVTLAAYYDSIRTTSGSSSYTSGFGGTSGATPIINGLGGNAIEMFTDGLFGYGAAASKSSAARWIYMPHFTTTKALLVATADQLSHDSTGRSRGATRYQQGFGFPSIRRLYDERDRLLVIDELDVLRQGQSRTYYLMGQGGSFHAAMNYADPAAAANATIHRINSVNLMVKMSDRQTYYGNHGLLGGNYTTPGGAANDRDTEESVILASAPEGLVEVTVSATGVRQDAHVQTSATDVDYALVVEGVAGLRDRSGLSLDLESSGAGDLTVTVGGVPGSGWNHGFTLFSLNTSRPLSTGNVLGLEFDTLAFSILRMSSGRGNVFHFTSGAGNNEFPKSAFQFPTPVALAVTGRTLDAVVLLLNGADLVGASNVDRVTVK